MPTYENKRIEDALAKKQDKLTCGFGIKIEEKEEEWVDKVWSGLTSFSGKNMDRW